MLQLASIKGRFPNCNFEQRIEAVGDIHCYSGELMRLSFSIVSTKRNVKLLISCALYTSRIQRNTSCKKLD